MSKRNYLKELKKVITLYKIEENDPYYYLFEYIKKTQRDLRILLIIDEIITKKLKNKKRYLEESLKRNLNGEIIEYDAFPVVGPMLKKIIYDQLTEYKTLEAIEGNKKIESLQNLPSENIVELETRIYQQVLLEMAEIEKRYNGIEQTTPREKQIQELKDQIEQICTNTLAKIEINNKRIVQDGKINIEVFKELYSELDDETIKLIHEVTEIETQKMFTYYRLQKELIVMDNIDKTFYQIVLEIIKEKIKKQDIKTIELLSKPNYKKEKESLIRNNNLINDRIRMNEYLPDYVEKFDSKIYEILNIRCRLIELKEKLKDITEKEFDISEKEKMILKQNIKNQIKNIRMGTTNTKDVMMLLKNELEKFKTKKKQELFERRNRLVNEKEKERIILEKIREKNNIKNIDIPSNKNITTPLEAIYIYNTLITLNESGKNMDNYRELIDFISDKKVEIINPKIEDIIRQITLEQFEKYFLEIKEQIKEEPQKKLTLEGE